MEWKNYTYQCTSVLERDTRYRCNVRVPSDGTRCWRLDDHTVEEATASERVLAAFIDNLNLCTTPTGFDESDSDDPDDHAKVAHVDRVTTIHTQDGGSHCAFRVNDAVNLVLMCWSDPTPSRRHLLQCFHVAAAGNTAPIRNCAVLCTGKNGAFHTGVHLALPMFLRQLGDMGLGLYRQRQESASNESTGVKTTLSEYTVCSADLAAYTCTVTSPIYYDVSSNTTSHF